MAGLPSRFVLERGSEFNPGWVVYDKVRPNYMRALGTFDDKRDAEEFLESVQADEKSVVWVDVEEIRRLISPYLTRWGRSEVGDLARSIRDAIKEGEQG